MSTGVGVRKCPDTQTVRGVQLLLQELPTRVQHLSSETIIYTIRKIYFICKFLESFILRWTKKIRVFCLVRNTHRVQAMAEQILISFDIQFH